MLTGDLAEFPMGSLLQSLAGPGKSGVLRIEVANQEGLIYLSGGKVVHAELDNVAGPRALTLLAGVRSAPFSFEESATPPAEITIETGIQTVLTRLLMEMSEWDKLQTLSRLDWSNVVIRGSRMPPREDAEAMGLVLGAEGRTILAILQEGSPLVVGERLNRALEEGWLRPRGNVSLEPVVLEVLPLYGREYGIAYVDAGLYTAWAKELRQPFSVKIRSAEARTGRLAPGRGGSIRVSPLRRRGGLGEGVVFGIRPRESIVSQIMLSERDLKSYSLNRGDRLEVIPVIL